MKRNLPTLKDYQNSACSKLNPHLFEEVEVKKKSKYRNTRTIVNNIKFDSKREADRYKQLLLLLKAGKIAFLKLQVEYELNTGGTHSLKYVADFTYTDTETGREIVEDSKGFKTREYLKKKRLMLKVHNISINEV